MTKFKQLHKIHEMAPKKPILKLEYQYIPSGFSFVVFHEYEYVARHSLYEIDYCHFVSTWST